VVKVNGLSHRSVYGAQNILILGSQTRDGQRPGDLGSNPSLDTSNSDNLILVHLDPTHTHALVLSIPRDTIVYEPGCKARRSVGTGIFGGAKVPLPGHPVSGPHRHRPGPVDDAVEAGAERFRHHLR